MHTSCDCPIETSESTDGFTVKECIVGEDGSCASNEICILNGQYNKSVCCATGKSSVMSECGSGRLFINPMTNKAMQCNTNSDCPKGAECTLTNGKRLCSCAVAVEHVEPPPTGCPWGTRPLKDHMRQVIRCSPGNPRMCPGNTTCHFDSEYKMYKCCGKDPGEGCPSGSKLEKRNGAAVKCSPGELPDSCSPTALCQWNYLAESYLCCLPHNGLTNENLLGCPERMVPFSDESSQIKACTPHVNGTCPQGSSCHFNFWIATYQCCRQTTRTYDMCPSGYRPLMNRINKHFVRCSKSMVPSCPEGNECVSTVGNEGVCCHRVDECPPGHLPVSSSTSQRLNCGQDPVNRCPHPAECMLSNAETSETSYLCCMPPTGLALCPAKYHPEDGSVKLCTSKQNACRHNSVCFTATATLSLCCSPSANFDHTCPDGYGLTDDSMRFCDGHAIGCPANSFCFSSFSEIGVCCSWSTFALDLHCPVHYTQTSHVNCQGDHMKCNFGASCFPTAAEGRYLCCSPTTIGLKCREPFRAVGEIPIMCIPKLSTCPPDSSCIEALNQPNVHLCCAYEHDEGAAAIISCPSGWTTEGGNVKRCKALAKSTCLISSKCLPSANDPAVALCCSKVAKVPARCEGNLVPMMSQETYVLCQQGHCPEGSTCSSLTGQSGEIALANDGVIVCDAGTRGQCPKESSCESESNNSRVGICCNLRRKRIECPHNEVPYQLDGLVLLCPTQSTSACPTNYHCQPSVSFKNVHICCGPRFTCPPPLVPVDDQPKFCHPSKLHCPDSSDCVQSSEDGGVYVCCKPPLFAGLQCPTSSSPLLLNDENEYCKIPGQDCSVKGYTCSGSATSNNKHLCCSVFTTAPLTCHNNQSVHPWVISCSPETAPCPSGYECTQSNIPNIFTCCKTINHYFCLTRTRPYPSEESPTMCSEYSHCPQGTSCSQSNVPGANICCCIRGDFRQSLCTESSGSMTQSNGKCLTTKLGTCPQDYVIRKRENGITVCCKASAMIKNRCPDGSWPSTNNCGFSSTRLCPSGYRCLTNTDGTATHCCPVPKSHQPPQDKVCGVRQSPYLTVRQTPLVCVPTNPSCPPGYSCQKDTSSLASPNVYYCCQKVLCIDGSDVTLNMLGHPLFCRDPNGECPKDTSCQPSRNLRGTYCTSKTTTGKKACCVVTVQAAEKFRICPIGDPYRDPTTRQLHYCSQTDYVCPKGFVCKQAMSQPVEIVSHSKVNDQLYVCCSGRPSCQSGWLPLFERSEEGPRKCHPNLYNACPNPYRCQESSVPKVYLCCMESAIARSENEEMTDAEFVASESRSSR
ncbi:unnamed protein product [Soboliphyme baturini]|uniref:Prion-like-(Q/N-rich) domain-bearing protein 25 n=1 Tax=Soboliphyme baturini TaxID=241478 RepID=A0A183ITM0_9BILA|nr:unnamed protein product [Soboliphyme baturini]